MRIARGLKPNQPNDFEIYSNDSLKSAFASIAGVVRIGAFVISLIALIAAGIGIMNIMLVSVTERTKEIGIRKSIGARSRDILRQFLTEAVFISEAGGIIGIILGVIGGNVLAAWLQANLIFPVRLGAARAGGLLGDWDWLRLLSGLPGCGAGSDRGAAFRVSGVETLPGKGGREACNLRWHCCEMPEASPILALLNPLPCACTRFSACPSWGVSSVEQDHALCGAIGSALRKFAPGRALAIGESLADAERLLAERGFDLLVIDFDPPLPDAVAFLQRIKAVQPNARVLVIIPGATGCHANDGSRSPCTSSKSRSKWRRLAGSSRPCSKRVPHRTTRSRNAPRPPSRGYDRPPRPERSDGGPDGGTRGRTDR